MVYILLWIDPYGFERPEDFDYASYEEFFSTYLVILTRRAIKWSKLLTGSSRVQKSMKVKRYIRKGVPFEHRARVWMGVSGAQAQMEQNPGYYHRLLQGEQNDSLEEAIRTELLGMNFIAGYLLLITKNEEESFWLLDALIGRILPDYYSPAMLGLKTDQEVLGELVRMKMPAVADLLEGHGVLWTLVVSRWFICLFIDILPVEKIFSEPGSLSMTTVTKLRERCRAKLLTQG
ncbi:growth hormone-regulated TBC protein 1 [Echinops telfairi]|uniref:Growth hormone-regulated TBC protein 1 n=1 Tax=Echinops telfairi TaxID=9371 RepID=A0AC55CKB3_ECHTE|nr:growth hormone-regulated TBC protein 1 [Echinops telfairi]